MLGGLSLVGVRMEWNSEKGRKILDRNRLVVFDLHALGAISRNRHDACAENRGAPRLLCRPLACLQQAWINSLRFQAAVDFFRTPPFEDNARNASDAVPDREI